MLAGVMAVNGCRAVADGAGGLAVNPPGPQPSVRLMAGRVKLLATLHW